ncbi:MAG: alpha/beta hydrolase [Actinomycetota bacterium]|nr:alpha/beta hydrolase [Actinomycetota bacterium]MDH5277485.1 alpha/beta hydrolase [Actinomycetota bacterium]
MTGATGLLTVPDGRVVDVYLGGDPDGFPLVMHHGTPSDATTFADWHEACVSRRLRLVCVSRPGYATSTRLPGRLVANAAQDTADVLDLLGCDAFLTAGWSGGGPHALACAALLEDRCVGAATLAGVGPYGVPDLDFLDGMGAENVDEFGAAVAGEPALRDWFAQFGEPFRTVTGDDIVAAFGGLVPQVDKDVLTGGYADQMAAQTRRALAQGFDGWLDDDLAFTRDWGFDLGHITVPVTVWQGDLDLMVPFAHGHWLGHHLSTATKRLVPGHGHISLVTSYQDQILDDLLDSSPPTT